MGRREKATGKREKGDEDDGLPRTPVGTAITARPIPKQNVMPGGRRIDVPTPIGVLSDAPRATAGEGVFLILQDITCTEKRGAVCALNHCGRISSEVTVVNGLPVIIR